MSLPPQQKTYGYGNSPEAKAEREALLATDDIRQQCREMVAILRSRPNFWEEDLEVFVRQFIKIEREACAKIAADYASRAFSGERGSDIAGVAADHIAQDIRARGNT